MHLEAAGLEAGGLEAFLSEMVAARLMLWLDDRYLSLAVSAELMGKHDPKSSAAMSNASSCHVL